MCGGVFSIPQLVSVKQMWQLNQKKGLAAVSGEMLYKKPSQVAFCCQQHQRCHELKWPPE